jgi:hypothetical protein
MRILASVAYNINNEWRLEKLVDEQSAIHPQSLRLLDDKVVFLDAENRLG